MSHSLSFGEQTYQIWNEWNFATRELIKYEIAFSKTSEKKAEKLKESQKENLKQNFYVSWILKDKLKLATFLIWLQKSEYTKDISWGNKWCNSVVSNYFQNQEARNT